jgi:HEAT repeat protein
MQKPTHRSIDELLDAYRDYLLSKVSKVRILGEANERELKEVFVELSIVEQRTLQQHAEFLGMMDSAMRRRFNPSADEDMDGVAERHEKEASRRVKPDELLRHRAKAIVTGAPGCGKTTLLKYLALQSQEKEKRLAVWLELKGIDKPLFAQAEKAAAQAGNLILQELWLRHLKTQLSLSDAEIKLLRQHWQEKFKANDIAVLLDGFDELQDDGIERSLNKCVREFASAAHDNTLLISTRPYAHHRLGKERLQELEVEPLNERQIESFLNCYYPNDAATKGLLKTLRERSALRELLHVPLLLGVILRLHRENRFPKERLKLYETIIADLVQELDRSKSVIRQFKINDERLRLDFLKFLAFERLLRDPLGKAEQEATRIIFSYDLLKEKARAFLAQERLSHHARDLADDALATPLLREVGADVYAFSHLTIQEYLAAVTLLRRDDYGKIFCRAYFNPALAEMEVLPMVLGLVNTPELFYTTLDLLPESLTFTSFRLRARGLAYAPEISQQLLANLTNNLIKQHLYGRVLGGTPYRKAVYRSFSAASDQFLEFIVNQIARLLFSRDLFILWKAAVALEDIGSERAVDAALAALEQNKDNALARDRLLTLLGKIGRERAVTPLLEALNDNLYIHRWGLIRDLGRIGGERVLEPLIKELEHWDNQVRVSAVEALGQIGGERAIVALSGILKTKTTSILLFDGENSFLRSKAAEALARSGDELAIGVLFEALKDEDSAVRSSAARGLGQVGGEQAIDSLLDAYQNADHYSRSEVAEALAQIGEKRAIAPLLAALEAQDSLERQQAALALGSLGGELAVTTLIEVLKSERTFSGRQRAVEALGRIGGERAVDALIEALSDKEYFVCTKAAQALGQLGSERAVEPLIHALKGENKSVRWEVARALGRIGSRRAVDPLIEALKDQDRLVRTSAAESLGQIGGEQAATALINVLKDQESGVHWSATKALAQIGGEQAVTPLIELLKGVYEASYWQMSAIEASKPEDRYVSAAEALGSMNEATLATGLLKALSHSDAFVRMQAAQAIGYYSNDQRALDQLKQLARTDENKHVRQAAASSAARFAHKLEILGHFITKGTAPPLIDNESRELFLVGEVFTIVAEAGHIFRPTANSDWGIDGEIEFKNDKGEASGQRVYLQLKSGDSYLRTRRTDGKEIFTIKNARHAEYWQSHAYPVLLVIRDSGGQIRWMNVTEYLQRQGTTIKQIEFQGEPFTAEGVKQMRARFTR